MIDLHVGELIIPSICSGILLPGIFLFAYLSIYSRRPLYLATFAFVLLGFLYAFLEIFVVYLGAVDGAFRPAAELYRLREVAIVWYLPVMPYFVAAVAVQTPVGRSVNRVTIGALFVAASAMTVIAFVAPDLFRSVTIQTPAAARFASAFGRGRAGPVYRLRDLLLALIILYSVVNLFLDMFRRPKADYRLGYVVAFAIVVLFGINDIYSNFFGGYIGPFSDAVYPRTVVGLSAFAAITMLTTITRYFDQSRAVETAHRRLQQSEKELAYLAFHDSLTHVRNRKALHQELSLLVEQGQRVTLLYVDLDDFKMVNDAYGHAAGDRVLRETVQRFTEVLRRSDELFRLAGDEFTLILRNTTAAEDAVLVAEKLIQSLRDPFDLQGVSVYLAVSVGIASFPTDAETPEQLLQLADAALYAAKRERNTFRIYSPGMEAAPSRIELVSRLRESLREKDFSLAYQPIVRSDGSVERLEVLLRWADEEGRFVPPDIFIPAAESAGLIHDLGGWVLIRAIQDLAQLRRDHPQVRLSVNVSPAQLRHKEFVPSVSALLQSAKIPGSSLELEITEGVLLEDPATVSERLEQLTAMGVTLAVDDFGTGYSSIKTLRSLPVSTIKIDRVFVSGLPKDGDNAAVVRGIISVSRELGLEVIAEGVETEEQREFLIEAGCRLFQGYLFSKPVPLASIRFPTTS